MTQAPGGGMISDNTPDAVAKLQRCACLQGGDAIIIGGMNEAGVIPSYGGYSQQVAKISRSRHCFRAIVALTD